MNYLPDNLKLLRKRKGVNQTELAKELGFKQQTIANWENAVTQPSVDDLLGLTKFFGISLDDLVGTNLIETGVNEIKDLPMTKEDFSQIMKKLEELKERSDRIFEELKRRAGE